MFGQHLLNLTLRHLNMITLDPLEIRMLKELWRWGSIALLFITIIFPLFFDSNTVLEATPTCYSVARFNKECSLCGMTRAFIEITNLNLKTATLLNRGSIPLFLIILLNSIFSVGLSLKEFLKRSNN